MKELKEFSDRELVFNLEMLRKQRDRIAERLKLTELVLKQERKLLAEKTDTQLKEIRAEKKAVVEQMRKIMSVLNDRSGVCKRQYGRLREVDDKMLRNTTIILGSEGIIES